MGTKTQISKTRSTTLWLYASKTPGKVQFTSMPAQIHIMDGFINGFIKSTRYQIQRLQLFNPMTAAHLVHRTKTKNRTMTTIIQSVYPSVCVKVCAKFEEFPSRSSCHLASPRTRCMDRQLRNIMPLATAVASTET